MHGFGVFCFQAEVLSFHRWLTKHSAVEAEQSDAACAFGIGPRPRTATAGRRSHAKSCQARGFSSVFRRGLASFSQTRHVCDCQPGLPRKSQTPFPPTTPMHGAYASAVFVASGRSSASWRLNTAAVLRTPRSENHPSEVGAERPRLSERQD